MTLCIYVESQQSSDPSACSETQNQTDGTSDLLTDGLTDLLTDGLMERLTDRLNY